MRRRTFLWQSVTVATIWPAVRPFSAIGQHSKRNRGYLIQQFKDEGLSHFSYAILADGQVMLIDPGRNPQPYYAFATEKQAKIIGVIETHPHADFVSSHLEIHGKEGATIYASKLVNAAYPHKTFDEGQHIELTDRVRLRAMHTPGHSPDSISILLLEDHKEVAVFTGDSLLSGAVGRPDLREYTGEAGTLREQLARQMFHTIHQKFAPLPNNVLVYPAHGAGSLCASTVRNVDHTTIGYEREHNFAFSEANEDAFVAALMKDQPHIPQYFPYDVELNKVGAVGYHSAFAQVSIMPRNSKIDGIGLTVIDARSPTLFRNSYIQGAINIPDGGKFETWLGTIVAPGEPFYLISDSEEQQFDLLDKTLKIGYETFIKGAFVYDAQDGEMLATFDAETFSAKEADYAIIDVRTPAEASQNKLFEHAANIPLTDLAARIAELPKGRPIAVHCASGYRSAIATSLIKKLMPTTEVLDIGEEVKHYP